jgi:outer membrane protein TolC
MLKKPAGLVALACLAIRLTVAQTAAGVPAQAEAALIPPLPASEAGARIVTLPEAIATLLAGNEDVKVLEGNLEAARAQHALNTSKNQPTLSGSGAYTITDGFGDQSLAKGSGASGLGIGQSLQAGLNYAQGTASQNSGTRLGLTVSQTIPVSPQTGQTGSPTNVAPTTSAAFTLSQVVWDGYLGGQSKALVDKSLLALQKSELAAKQARSAAQAKVKQAYVTTLVAQRTLALRLGILDKQKALLKQIEATYALKQASSIDLSTARINARSAELDVETSRHDFALARQRLANILGMPADSDFRVAEIDTPPLPAASLEEATASGLAARVDVAQLDLTRRSSIIDAALARGSGQPTLTATGGVSAAYSWSVSAGGGAKSLTDATGEAVNLGLRLGLPILDAGAAKAQEKAAQAAITVVSTQAAQLADSVAADIRDAWWNVGILTEKIDLAKQSVDLAEAQLALVKQQLEFGTATNQDLLSAAVIAANAEAGWLKSKSDQLLAVLALETAMGR